MLSSKCETFYEGITRLSLSLSIPESEAPYKSAKLRVTRNNKAKRRLVYRIDARESEKREMTFEICRVTSDAYRRNADYLEHKFIFL